jgi:NAD(P)-dependent dehydrogenase (short-subunit alcohol dehydrogenase family)
MGKTAIVVGGTGGIGVEVVHTFRENGYRTVVIARGQNNKRLSEFEGCPNVTLYKGDVTKVADYRSLLETILKDLKEVDYVVYSTGLPPDTDVPLSKYSLGDWDRTFDIYVKGFLLTFQATLSSFKEGGHIIMLGSAITRFSWDSLPPISAGHYAAAKAAAAELVKWARREAHEHGVLVSLVSPGAVDTASHRTGTLTKIPKRLLPVKSVTDTVLSLLSNRIEANIELVA